MYHRPFPTVRAGTPSPAVSREHSSRSSPALAPSPFPPFHDHSIPPMSLNTRLSREDAPPTVFGLPLKFVSLVTLAVQNAALSIVMHYSRVSTPPSQSYSPASAVLLNEILKGSISFGIALWRLSKSELSIPALLYVVQNSLQFVAISNLPVATFQVTYQMKILTTAAFSVLLLRRRLSSTKWVSLFFLAIGVAIVQIQTSTSALSPQKINVPVGSAHESAPLYLHIMSPLKGFGAVTAACFTSGLAGVYFEMVLKNSKADLWVRNVQLSLFSLVPALVPVLYSPSVSNSRGFADLLKNFGGWAWATVAIQVFGGLITAIVIKYSDNILKGFATSLSIILSFLASVFLFNFSITPSFLIGSSTVLIATWLYNQPAGKEPTILVNVVNGTTGSKAGTPWPGSPVESDGPILGQFDSQSSSPRTLSMALGPEKIDTHFPPMVDTPRYLSAPYGSPFPSRTPSPAPVLPS
ncbi:nucleotide-sugar transporter-domain-containing protein [Multifurca ochricompacta]|uniref:Nucleotide-sugar transporter-domain-containing protein n=1 Tax=Multifurca ochricompacta TaxID=376703 RepID=A0AAD4MB81_9AGAM|nr:nucleotide-sugar transporter-domain-containing protein [Multifurca ochricompacta]